MSRRTKVLLATLVVAGASSFLLGRQTQMQTQPGGAAQTVPAGEDGKPCCRHGALCNYLKLTSDQKAAVIKADPGFVDDADRLEEQVEADRDALAALLENPGSSDEQVTSQVERVIASHDALERRVAQHMLALRPILTPQQTKQLMGLAANGVRNARRCQRWSRQPGQPDPCTQAGPPAEPGRYGWGGGRNK